MFEQVKALIYDLDMTDQDSTFGWEHRKKYSFPSLHFALWFEGELNFVRRDNATDALSFLDRYEKQLRQIFVFYSRLRPARAAGKTGQQPMRYRTHSTDSALVFLLNYGFGV